MTEQTLYSTLAVACSLFACVTDLRKRIIPNALTFSSAFLGLLLHFVNDGWTGLSSSLSAGLAAGALFAILFICGGMGAGDVKLIAAIGFLNGLPSIGLLLVGTVLSGGIFGLMLAIRNGRVIETFRNVFSLAAHHVDNGVRQHISLNVQNEATLRIPYAVPIAVGCIAAACSTLQAGV